MAGAVAQSKIAEAVAAATTLASGSLSASVTSGNYLWIVTNNDSTSTSHTVTKNGGTATIGAVTNLGFVTEAGPTDTTAHHWCRVTGSGTIDMLVTYGASSGNRVILVFEISGVNGVIAGVESTDGGNDPTGTTTINFTSQPGFGMSACIDMQGGTPGVSTSPAETGYTDQGTFGGTVHNIRVLSKSFTSTGNHTVNNINAGLDRNNTMFIGFTESGKVEVVQESGGDGDNASTATLATTFPVNAGNLIVISVNRFISSGAADPFVAGDCVKSAGTATIDTVTLDNQFSQDVGASERQQVAIFSCLVTGAGTLTMQVSGNASDYWTITVSEVFSTTGWNASRVEATNSTGDATDNATPGTTGNGTSVGHAYFHGVISLACSGSETITPVGSFVTIYEQEGGTLHQVGSHTRLIVTTGTTTDASWTLQAAHRGYAAALAVYRGVVVTTIVITKLYSNGQFFVTNLVEAGASPKLYANGTYSAPILVESLNIDSVTGLSIRHYANGTSQHLSLRET